MKDPEDTHPHERTRIDVEAACKQLVLKPVQFGFDAIAMFRYAVPDGGNEEKRLISTETLISTRTVARKSRSAMSALDEGAISAFSERSRVLASFAVTAPTQRNASAKG